MFFKVITALTVMLLHAIDSKLLSSRLTRYNNMKVLEIDSDVYRLRLYMSRKSYADAQAECQRLGGFVIFNTEARQQEISNDINEASKKLLFYEQSLLKRTSFWIGGGYDNENWRWQSGEQIPLHGNNQQWYAGQPNRPGDDCMYMMRKGGWFRKSTEKWFDGNCQRRRYFICEINNKFDYSAEDGTTAAYTKQLEFVHEKAVFDTGYYGCKRKGVDLLAIDSQDTEQLVVKQVRNSFRLFPESIRNSPEIEFWIKSSSFLKVQTDIKQPCAYISVKSRSKKFLNPDISFHNGVCSERKASICEKIVDQVDTEALERVNARDVTVETDSGLQQNNQPQMKAASGNEYILSGVDSNWVLTLECPPDKSSCSVTPKLRTDFKSPGYEIVFHRKKMTFEEASNHCDQTSGHLVMLDRSRFKFSVTDHLLGAEPMVSSLLQKSDNGFWVGASYDDQHSIWTWLDGSAVGTGGDWYVGEPKRNTSGECMFVSSGVDANYQTLTRGKWFSDSCESKRFFVCQKYIRGLEEVELPHVIDGIHEDWIMQVKCDGATCSLTPVIKESKYPK